MPLRWLPRRGQDPECSHRCLPPDERQKERPTMAMIARKAHRTSTRGRQNLVLILPLLALLGYRLFTRERSPASVWDVALDIGGMTLLLAGLCVRIYARQWKAERAHDGLVTDGLYGYVRHPLYLGSFLLGTGLCLIMGDAALLGLFLVFFWVNHGLVIRREEADLERLFGEGYRAYRTQVPALLPKFALPWRGIAPRRLREGVVREGDSICVWLALPLLIQLAEWLARGSARTGGAGVHGSYPMMLLVAVVLLAALWLSLKTEWRTLIHRERQRP